MTLHNIYLVGVLHLGDFCCWPFWILFYFVKIKEIFDVSPFLLFAPDHAAWMCLWASMSLPCYSFQNLFLLFVEGTTSLASSTSPYNCSLVRICHDTSIGLEPLSQTTACSPNGVAPFFLSISYNQPLFLIAQSGDAISGERDSDV